MERYAIIGFGSAGFAALKAIRESGCDAQVEVYSEHGYAPYNPMLTTYYIKGAIPYEAMFPLGSLDEIAERYNCAICTNTRVVSMNPEERSITLQDGTTRTYDKILVSTGAAPVMLPVGNLPADKIYAMRTVDDAKRLCASFDSGEVKKILVVGASWVGIKVVEAAWTRGIESVLSDLAPHIFMTSAFERASEKCEEYLKSEAIDLHFGVKTEECYLNDDGSCHVNFSDGSSVDVDIVAMCVGIRPSLGFIEGDQIQINRGIIVDNNMESSVPGIYAAGDAAEGTDIMTGKTRHIGLWANSQTQGRCAGLAMAGAASPVEGNFLHNITHFLDYNFVSFGDKDMPGERKVLLDDGPAYIEVLTNEDKLYCINMLSDYELSGAVKNIITRYFSSKEEPLDEIELGVLAKSGLPNELIRILGGMVR